MNDCEEYKHKYEVAEKLRQQMKEFFKRTTENFGDAETRAHWQENMMMSQSYVEKQNSMYEGNLGKFNGIDTMSMENELSRMGTLDKKGFENLEHGISHPQFASNTLEFIAESEISSPIKQAQRLYGIQSSGSTGGLAAGNTKQSR